MRKGPSAPVWAEPWASAAAGGTSGPNTGCGSGSTTSAKAMGLPVEEVTVPCTPLVAGSKVTAIRSVVVPCALVAATAMVLGPCFSSALPWNSPSTTGTGTPSIDTDETEGSSTAPVTATAAAVTTSPS